MAVMPTSSANQRVTSKMMAAGSSSFSWPSPGTLGWPSLHVYLPINVAVVCQNGLTVSVTAITF
jgi:hypothetical protein